MQNHMNLFNESTGPSPRAPRREKRRERGQARVSKKSRVIDLFTAGVTDLGEIAARVNTTPSYVATVLQSAGLLSGYFDLYTTTRRDQNLYSRYFRNVLSFRNVEAAKESVAQIDRLYKYFERIGDRAGQHHAEVIALTGRNRARWSGKEEEAKIFREWLCNH